MTQAVDSKQIELLEEIMSMKFFEEFYLAGGTNLALKYAHRHSIDLDFFIEKDFNLDRSNRINRELKGRFKKRFESIAVTDIGVFGFIDGVKTNFIHFPYPMLKALDTVKKFRLASDTDIAAMKINAINGRGSRKDFHDIHLLLQNFNLEDMLAAYKKKFGVDNVSMSLRSLVYFDDAENKENPNNVVQSHKGISWDEIKRDIVSKVRELG